MVSDHDNPGLTYLVLELRGLGDSDYVTQYYCRTANYSVYFRRHAIAQVKNTHTRETRETRDATGAPKVRAGTEYVNHCHSLGDNKEEFLFQPRKWIQ